MQKSLALSSRVCGTFLASILLAALGRPAVAEVHPLRIMTQTCTGPSCLRTTAYGSAVSIGRFAPAEEIFLTAAHCVAGQVHRIEVGIQREWHPARVLARSANRADLALLSVTYEGRPIRASQIAAVVPDFRTAVTLTGFPQGKNYRRRLGTVIPGRYSDFDLIIDQPSLPGESGGGIFNSRGELVGITAATAPAESPTQTLASGIESIHQLLRQVFPAAPICRQPKAPKVPPSAELAALENELARLRSQIAALEARVSQPQPADPAVLQRLERLELLEIPVQILTPDGQILDEARYRLGEPLQFRLVPRRE